LAESRFLTAFSRSTYERESLYEGEMKGRKCDS